MQKITLSYEEFEKIAKKLLWFVHQKETKEQSKKMIEILNSLEELDDVQNIFTNTKLNIEK